MLDTQDLEKIIVPASSAFTAFEGSVRNVGSDVQKAWRELRDVVTPMPSIGQDAAALIAKVRVDDSLPQDHRARTITETHALATDLLDKLRQAGHERAGTLETALGDALIPRPATDAGERQLRRGEVDMMLASASGPALMSRMVAIIERGNNGWTSELLGDYGRARMVAEGVGNDWNAVRGAAIAKLMQQPGGTERQRAARAALTDFHRLNIKGHVTSYHQAGSLPLL
jgi:hypothetical protein